MSKTLYSKKNNIFYMSLNPEDSFQDFLQKPKSKDYTHVLNTKKPKRSSK